MPEVATGLSIGQVAERTGLSAHALRYYEREGILANPVRRGPGGRRVYSEYDVEWLILCTRFRATGMPMAVIRQYTELVRQGDGNEQDRLALLRAHRKHVAAQIGALAECLELISHKVRVYEDRLAAGAAGPTWSSSSFISAGGEPVRSG